MLNIYSQMNGKNGSSIGDELLLATGKMSRRTFIKRAMAAGVAAGAAAVLADTSLAIAQNQNFNAQNLQSEYDYIVCGAGSAGCVIASQLAEDGTKSVLLLEAGGSDDVDKILSPLWFGVFLNPDYFWTFNGEPEAAINQRKPLLPMGKVIGGGSSVNALVYSRGHQQDYDEWAEQLSDNKWSYENVLKVFREMEHFNGPEDARRRGKGGKFWSELPTEVHEVAKGLKSAGGSFGIPAVDDLNGATLEAEAGIGFPNVIVKDGKRHSVARSFLYPLLAQSNLTVLTGANVQKVVLDGDKATGVEVVYQGNRKTISAGRQTILSMGALKTPQVLMVSGIGDQDVLNRAGVKVEHKLAGVGRNFHDHPLVAGCIWEYKKPIAPVGSGSQCTFFARVNSTEVAPDLMPVQLQVPFASEVHSQADIPASAWTIVPGLAKPKSRGQVTIKSADPNDAPVTNTGFLSDENDIETLRRGIELTRELGNSSEMKEFVKREVLPTSLKGQALDEFIRNGVATYYHMSGTCKMGNDNDEFAVLDSNCAVRGIRNLSVADTSAFPDIPRGNTMVPAAMLAYQIADHLINTT